MQKVFFSETLVITAVKLSTVYTDVVCYFIYLTGLDVNLLHIQTLCCRDTTPQKSSSLSFDRHLPCRKELRIKPMGLKVHTRRSRPDQARTGQIRPDQTRPGQARSDQTRPDHESLTLTTVLTAVCVVTVRHNRDAFCAILCQSAKQPNIKSVRLTPAVQDKSLLYDVKDNYHTNSGNRKNTMGSRRERDGM